MSKNKCAFITGITGQDGAYLAELLIKKGYIVHGLRRRSSSFNTSRIEHLYQDPHISGTKLFLHYGDMTDSLSLLRVLEKIQPDEVYNLAAQSHVHVSFEEPEYTANSDALGTLRLLEGIRILSIKKHVKFYQASTSELYGKIVESPQNENTPFNPQSPYAVAKLYAYWITINYRNAYDIFASNGILFNHESPVRGETFVTRKITRALCRIKLGIQKTLFLGNLDAKRDWGHAKDFVEAQWLILQHKEPGDFVIATGQQKTVRQFVEKVCALLEIDIYWEGDGLNETGVDNNSGNALIKVDSAYFRPTEVDNLLGDASKAKRLLGWEHTTSFDSLVKEMVEHDMRLSSLESSNKTLELN